MSVPTGGARPRITYITWRERSTLWDMKGTRSLERFMFGITACHCGTLPWSFVGLLFRVWTQPLRLALLCCSVSSLHSVFSLLSGRRRTGRRKQKSYGTGRATRFQERLRRRLTIVGFLLFHLVAGVFLFFLLGFVCKRPERQAVWNWNCWLCCSGMAGLYVCVSTFLVRSRRRPWPFVSAPGTEWDKRGWE